MINTVIAVLANNNSANESGEDNSLDLADKVGGSKEGKDGKGGGGSDKSSKVNLLFEFLTNLLDDIKNNNVLRDTTSYFAHKNIVQG